MRGLFVTALSIAAFALGCSSEGASPTPADGGGGGGSAEGTGGAPQSEPALHLSFVAETEPGEAPALLRMFNDSQTETLSLTLPTGEAFSFYLVGPGNSTDYALIASDDMLEDAILSLHTLDTCVRRPFSSMSGPLVLEPGHAYSIHVSQELAADIVEEPMPEPYVGLRAILDDPAQPSQVGAASTLVVSGVGMGERTFEDIYDELPAPHVDLGVSELVIDQVRFTDLAGVVHTASGPATIGSAFGYTAYLGSAPVGGAAVTIELERQ